MHRTMFTSFLALVLGAPLGCTGGGMVNLPTLAPQWSREEFRPKWSLCGSRDCRVTLTAPRGPLVVAAQTKTYGLHEIPGWDTGSTTGRVVAGILRGVIRRQGFTTESVEIGLGTRTVTDSSGGWELRCSVLWVDEQDEEYNRKDDDHVAKTTRVTEGADCRGVTITDTSVARWRFRAGIAPPRDSLAAIYDSLVTAKSPMVSAVPPMSLERVAPQGAVEARYEISRDALTFAERLTASVRTRIKREGGETVALLYTGFTTGLDLAADVTDEEARVLRLVAGIMTTSFKTIVE